MSNRALIPVKALSQVKSRLAPYLSQVRRAELVLHMLHHVITTLQESQALESIAIVSPDKHVLKLAQMWGAHAYLEEQQGHNPALHAAALRETAGGASALLTISADLPLLSPEDIQNMFAYLHAPTQADVVLAPSCDETGTNALLVRPPLVIPYLFGEASFSRHLQAAQQRELHIALYRSTGTALDIDTINDLTSLPAQSKAFLYYEREKQEHHL